MDRLLIEACREIFVPAELLTVKGRVSTPDLDAAGVILEVIDPDDFPGDWKPDYSRWPEATRPHPVRPDIALTMRLVARTEGGGGGIVTGVLDGEGNHLDVRGGITARDRWLNEYRENGPAMAQVRTMLLQMHGQGRMGAGG